VERQEDPEQQLRRALSRVIEAGYQVEPETMKTMKDLAINGLLEKVVGEAIEKASKQGQRPLFLPRIFLESAEPTPVMQVDTLLESTAAKVELYAKQVENQIEIIQDPGKEIGLTKDIEALLHHFNDRFSRISDILKQRSDARTAITIEEALKAPPRVRNRIICMITEKRERTKSLFLTVEDSKSQALIAVSSSIDRSILDKARGLFLDQVVCIEVSRTQGEIFIAHDFLNPDIPDKPAKESKDEIYAALLSDLHIGSQKFLSSPFKEFLRWLQGDSGDSSLRRVASRLKYIVIAGDLVDGIGVYPGQERELDIRDIYEQYAAAANILSEIPKYIQVILIPGNHDPTLQALPQPPISEKYTKPLLDLGNVTSLGNPARIGLHGVDILIYHGNSLNDIIGTVSGVTYQNLDKTICMAMRSLIKVRHLAPVYGGRTPIIPQSHDRLVIDKVPDILHCGHVHVTGYEMYRGTLLLNSGTWQTQTEYQERMGVVPTPGTAPVVNLKNLTVIPLKYTA
jgi:DNA polymerase II small subunit